MIGEIDDRIGAIIFGEIHILRVSLRDKHPYRSILDHFLFVLGVSLS
jgi:hypothetical protein